VATRKPDRLKPNKGNKGKQINDWFANHPRLGFSVLLQDGIADETYESYSRNLERQLLEGYRRPHGVLPPWSGIWGSRVGAGYLPNDSAAWVDYTTGEKMVWLLRTRRFTA
jgi:hypothetical protein